MKLAAIFAAAAFIYGISVFLKRSENAHSADAPSSANAQTNRQQLRGRLSGQNRSPPTSDLSFLRRLGGALIVLVGLISAFVTIFGPLWPTAPSFEPGAPSLGSAFNIPFKITNDSALVPITGLTFKCHLLSARWSFKEFSAEANVEDGWTDWSHPNRLERRKSAPYTCRFANAFNFAGPLVSAQMEIVATYNSPWGGSESVTEKSDIYTWNSLTNPPQWMTGVPLK